MAYSMKGKKMKPIGLGERAARSAGKRKPGPAERAGKSIDRSVSKFASTPKRVVSKIRMSPTAARLQEKVQKSGSKALDYALGGAAGRKAARALRRKK